VTSIAASSDRWPETRALESSMSEAIEELNAHGQSVWLDYIRRGILDSGELERMVREGLITGVTSNPSIFQKAIAASQDYDDALVAAARDRPSAYEAFLRLGGDDIRRAADALRPVYDRTQGADGFVSFEVQDANSEEMQDEARRLWELVGRPNLMIKVPAIPAGVPAARQLLYEGINVNVTLLFDVAVYERFAKAYIEALEQRQTEGKPVDRIAGVASFFVSRVDTKADELLPPESALRGRIAVANAHMAYRSFERIFDGPRWQKLAAAGARVQRPLWASTSTKNPAYSDVLYVEELIAPHTVNTLPEATLRAFIEHGRVRPSIAEGIAGSERVLAEAAAAGIDLEAIGRQLLDEGIAAFRGDFDKLLSEIETALKRHSLQPDLDEQSQAALARLEQSDLVERIWRGDHRVWKPGPEEISDPNRLGWLASVEPMLHEVDDLQQFAAAVRAEGIETAVLLGMGGSSLAPEVFHETFGPRDGGLDLKVLDTTLPADILAADAAIDPRKTLFIVSSKSGGTIETMSLFEHFWQRTADGRRFIAITDPGTSLAALGRERGFRRVFLNSPDMGGRYSAISYFGLVPAALMGVDLRALLGRAQEMQTACRRSEPSANPGLTLGAALGAAALAGRDKLTLVLPPEVSALGAWLEQLIAESTGKEGKGIIPVVDEPLAPPAWYGADRIFVALGDNPGLSALEAAGHQVLRIPFGGKHDLAAEFFRWEFATAVAGHMLGINPFDQPNVEEAKAEALRFLAGGAPQAPSLPGLDALLSSARPGDYVALLAYLPRTAAVRESLQAARGKLQQKLRLATTAGFGPRYLHSTGQVHKGGPNSGIFVVLSGDPATDVPIPAKAYSFGDLNQAQAAGDIEALIRLGRRVTRATLEQLQSVLQ
jgi:transaldolase/glucose-6-phosphate isomerase